MRVHRFMVSVAHIDIMADLHLPKQMSSDDYPQSHSSGWNAIQTHMLAHDEDMIGDFADDIDTLLVFVSGVT